MDHSNKAYRKRLRKLHLWVGLLGFMWFGVISLTGILLNHPDLLSSIDLPRKYLPGDYSYRDWNRASFRSTLSLEDGRTLIYGEAGVWLYRGMADAVEDFSNGLPENSYQRDVRALILFNGKLFAGTRGGLYIMDGAAKAASFKPVPLGDAQDLVTDLFTGDGTLYALTRSNLYQASQADPASFTPVTLSILQEKFRRPSLFRLIFEVHNGALWGLPGRLLLDFTGVAAIFLCFSGAWFWYKKHRKELVKGRGGKIARKSLKYHVKIGLYLSPLLLLATLTGIFERPPFLIAIASATYPEYLHPAPQPQNPWEDKFRKGVFDPVVKRLVLSTSQGVYEVDEREVKSGSGRLVPVYGGPPVSVMGATVFKKEAQDSSGDTYLVGSMSGLYRWDRRKKLAFDLFTGERPAEPSGPPVGQRMVMGMGVLEDHLVWADYAGGLFDGAGSPVNLKMPQSLEDGGRISLWHALFEIHNGRIFEFLLGWWSWIVVPLTGLLFLIEIVTGLIDRLVKTKTRG